MKNVYFFFFLLFSSIGFSAFLDPSTARAISQKILSENRDNLPLQNIGLIQCTPQNSLRCIMGGCLLINNKFALTSAHARGILDSNSQIFIVNSNSIFNYGPGGNMNFETSFPSLKEKGIAQKVRCVHPLHKVTFIPPSCVFSEAENAADSTGTIKEVAIYFSTTPYSATNDLGKEIVTEYDLVLLQLEEPFNKVRPLELKSYEGKSNSLPVRGIFYPQNSTFWTGEETAGKAIPPIAAQLNSSLRIEPRLIKLNQAFARKMEQQVFYQTVYLVPNKPRCFSLFYKHPYAKNNNESFDPNTSKIFHPSLNRDEMACFGPFVRGSSGSPIFHGNQFVGLVSAAFDMTIDGSPATINAFQMLTQDIIDRIYTIMSLDAIKTINSSENIKATIKACLHELESIAEK